jgi:hypothetical protein
MYEQRTVPPVSRAAFLGRLAGHAGITLALVVLSLGAGMWGYAYFEHLGWCDAFLNAAMLLGGMGPVETPVTRGGKLFAGLYALYAGLVFLVAAGIMGAPVFHRLMHQFHWESGHDDGG